MHTRLRRQEKWYQEGFYRSGLLLWTGRGLFFASADGFLVIVGTPRPQNATPPKQKSQGKTAFRMKTDAVGLLGAVYRVWQLKIHQTVTAHATAATMSYL